MSNTKKSALVRAIARDGSGYILACDSTAIVARARELHNTSKTMTAVLGRCLTATSLMGALLKSPQNTLTMQIKCSGPAENIVCVSDYRGNVRGYAEHPEVEVEPRPDGKLNVGGAVGSGTLYVIKDLGMEEPYVGLSELVSGEIAEDVTSYFAKSEQIPSACALGVRMNQDLTCKGAGGFLVQLLPGADDSFIDLIEKNIEKSESVSKIIADGGSADDIIDAIFDGIEYDILDRADIEFRCNCSRERYRRVLCSMQESDLCELTDTPEPTETVCSFCGQKYQFTNEEILNIIAEKLAK